MLSIFKGDVCNIKSDKQLILVHCCNDIGGFGGGIAGNIAKKWPHIAESYHQWHEKGIWFSGGNSTKFYLGEIQIVRANDEYMVCNLIGQKGIGQIDIGAYSMPPVYYSAIEEGFRRLLLKVNSSDNPDKYRVVAPLLGCRLAGGKLEIIYDIANKVFGNTNLFSFYAYTDEDFKSLQKIHKQKTGFYT